MKWLIDHTAELPTPPVLWSGGLYYFPSIPVVQHQIVGGLTRVLMRMQKLLGQVPWGSTTNDKREFAARLAVVQAVLSDSTIVNTLSYIAFGFGMIGRRTRGPALSPEYWPPFVSVHQGKEYSYPPRNRMPVWGGNGQLLKQLFR